MEQIWLYILIWLSTTIGGFILGSWQSSRAKAREFADIMLIAEDEGFITVHETPAGRDAHRTRIKLTVAGKVHTMLFPLKNSPRTIAAHERRGKHHIKPRSL